MAVVGTAKPIGEGRDGEEGEDGLKRFSRTYIVQTDSANDGPDTVRSATGLPDMGSPYPSHPSAVVVRRTPRPLSGTRLAWHVEVEWSTHSIDRDENPLNTKTEIEYGYETYDEPVAGTSKLDVDITTPQGTSASDANPNTSSVGYYGFPVLNAAGDPIPGLITRPNFYPLVRVTRNEASFDAIKAIQYGNTVNAISWNGLLPRQAWLKPIEASSETQYASGIDQPDIRYWRVRYTFVLKATTWDTQLLNIGPNYLTVPNTTTNWHKYKAGFTSSTGQPTVGFLKQNGTRYSSSETAVPTWIPFRILREVEFGPLAINLNLALNELRRRV